MAIGHRVSTPELDELQARIRLQKARRMEIENDIKLGKVFMLADYERQRMAQLVEYRQQLEEIPARLAQYALTTDHPLT